MIIAYSVGCRGMGVLEIFYVLKQRDDSFRTNLWEAAESFMVCITFLIFLLLITVAKKKHTILVPIFIYLFIEYTWLIF